MIEKRAFTLFELLVVLLLMSLALGLIIPRLDTFLRERKGPFFQELEDLLQAARQRALTQGEVVYVVIDPETRKVLATTDLIQNEGVFRVGQAYQKLAIPTEIELKAQALLRFDNLRGVIFFRDGTSSGGEIEIINHKIQRQYLIRIPKSQFLLSEEFLS